MKIQTKGQTNKHTDRHTDGQKAMNSHFHILILESRSLRNLQSSTRWIGCHVGVDEKMKRVKREKPWYERL